MHSLSKKFIKILNNKVSKEKHDSLIENIYIIQKNKNINFKK